MNSEIVKILCDVYDNYGSSLFDDAQKLKGMLSDILYDFPKERKRFNLLIDENIIEEILKPETDVSRLRYLAQTLNDDIGIDIEVANELVFSIAYVVYRKEDYSVYFSSIIEDNDDINQIILEIENLLDEDEEKAFSLALEYAEKGYGKCMTILGTMYRDGIGVTSDANKGYEYILRAANLNDADACFELALFYETGEVVDEDIAKAIEMLKKSATLGLDDAYFRLGAIYENTYKDLESALKYYLIAAEKGICESYRYIADIYINIESLNMDANKANEFYQKSINEGLFVEYSKYMMSKCRSEILGAKYNVSVLSLLKRGKEALKKRDWNEANRFFDQILNVDPDSCDAYYGKFLVDIRCPEEENMVEYWFNSERYECPSYKKVKSIAVGSLKSDLDYYEKELSKKMNQRKSNFIEKYNMFKNVKGIIRAKGDGFIAVKSDGTLVSRGHWGDINVQSTNLEDFDNIVAIDCSNKSIVGLKSDGTVVAIGLGNDGNKIVAVSDALDDNSRYQYADCDVSQWKNIIQISCSSEQTVGLRKDGTVVCASKNMQRVLDVSSWKSIVNISDGGSTTIGIKGDGSIIYSGEYLPTVNSVIDAYSNHSFTALIMDDGKIYGHGLYTINDKARECLEKWTDVVSIKKGAQHIVGLKADGTVAACFCELEVLSDRIRNNGQCNVSHWKDVVAIECGYYSTFAITSDGHILTTDSNLKVDDIRLFDNIKTLEEERKVKHREYNERKKILLQNQPMNFSGRKSIFGSSKFTEIENKNRPNPFRGDNIIQATKKAKKCSQLISVCAESVACIRPDGTIIGEEKVKDWKNIIAISKGKCHTVGLKSNGTVVAIGENKFGECNVQGWRDIVAISAGWWHTVGLKADGTVVAVGFSEYGRCNVQGWNNIIEISAGGENTVGLKADGTVVAVGNNSLGNCNVQNLSNITSISAGTAHTVGLKADGTVVAVGYQDNNRCMVQGWRDIIAISAGVFHTVGLKADGTVIAIGNNSYGQCNVQDWNDIVAVAAGEPYTFALKADGTILSTGTHIFKNTGVCKYCGGPFKGLFTKICTKCGKTKDY